MCDSSWMWQLAPAALFLIAICLAVWSLVIGRRARRFSELDRLRQEQAAQAAAALEVQLLILRELRRLAAEQDASTAEL